MVTFPRGDANVIACCLSGESRPIALSWDVWNWADP